MSQDTIDFLTSSEFIELISFAVPVTFIGIALTLAFLLATQIGKQQKQRTPARRYQTQITPTATPKPKSIQSSNQIGYGVAVNGVANAFAIYLIYTGVPTNQAYVYAYCGVICLGILTLLPFHLESKLLNEEQPNQHFDYSASPQPSARTPPPALLAGLDFTKPHPLKVQFLAMVGGHHPTASRLLTQAVRENPGRSLEWYYEKVIQDLIRDRR